MRITLLAVGRLKSGPETELVARYAERATALGRTLALTPFKLVELAEHRGKRPDERRRGEAADILAHANEGIVVAFDERGSSLSSDDLAAKVSLWRDGGAPALTIIIGGPDGLDESVRQRADLVLAFGALTIPHQIVRALVAEQVYRVMTIMAGHPYHRA